jgi:hypothetical protein
MSNPVQSALFCSHEHGAPVPYRATLTQPQKIVALTGGLAPKKVVVVPGRLVNVVL